MFIYHCSLLKIVFHARIWEKETKFLFFCLESRSSFSASCCQIKIRTVAHICKVHSSFRDFSFFSYPARLYSSERSMIHVLLWRKTSPQWNVFVFVNAAPGLTPPQTVPLLQPCSGGSCRLPPAPVFWLLFVAAGMLTQILSHLVQTFFPTIVFHTDSPVFAEMCRSRVSVNTADLGPEPRSSMWG